tara:strand:- start:5508 stop:5699 length:192 start_codon:yes stop_codon:yes gene_type:complete
MLEKLETKTEKCPFIDYCVDGARLSDIGVCRGEKGNYTECETIQFINKYHKYKEGLRQEWRDE